jgi:hypothetical protein
MMISGIMTLSHDKRLLSTLVYIFKSCLTTEDGDGSYQANKGACTVKCTEVTIRISLRASYFYVSLFCFLVRSKEFQWVQAVLPIKLVCFLNYL